MKYTTVQGDTWDGIAYSELGSCGRVSDLMRRNGKHLHYLSFPAGIELELPEVEDRPAPTLPPWKGAEG